MNPTTQPKPEAKPEAKTNKNKVSVAALEPNFAELPDEIQVFEKTFWLGLSADCPRGQIDVAGLHFPKLEEEIKRNQAGKQVRNPVIGCINKTVTRAHFDALVKALPRYIIRPHKDADLDDPKSLAKGKLIKLPDPEAVHEGPEMRRKLKPYVQRPGDRPATEFMFFMHAPSGKRGNEYQTIAEAGGLEWPDDEKNDSVN